MSGARNAVMGEADSPIELPKTQVPEEVLTDEKKMARYSQSAEFKRLRKFMQDRIEFFQKYFPNGQRVQDLPESERSAYWQAACIVVSEFQGVLDEYERAREVVSDAGSKDV